MYGQGYMPGLTGAAAPPNIIHLRHPGNTIKKTTDNPNRRAFLRTQHFDPIYGADDDVSKLADNYACKYCRDTVSQHIQQITQHLIDCILASPEAKGILYNVLYVILYNTYKI